MNEAVASPRHAAAPPSGSAGALRRITVFNTSYLTGNLGDKIIMESVEEHLHEMFPYGFFTGVPLHDQPGPVGLAAAREGDYSFVGGTNMLASHWPRYHQIKLRLSDVWRINPLILMGVGWHKYQRDPDPFTRIVYRRLLSRTHLHSLRDRYTHDKLKRIGFDNVVYTGCPTMWRLTPEHLATIPTVKAPRCVFALTAYLKDRSVDRTLVELLVDAYEQVLFWPQMYDDLAYLREIASDLLDNGRIVTLEPSFEAVEAALVSGDVDYLGSRLHCGVLALQNGVRTLIVTVDNRATEISRDTNLPTVARDRFDVMRAWTEGSEPIRLDMPFDDIARWKRQFGGVAG